jgi:UDP-glucose 4-epimerase
MTKQVLIAGAYGFIGRHVARSFAQKGWQVTGIGHGNWTEEAQLAWGVSQWYSMDINLSELERLTLAPDAIVHCAGTSTVAESFLSPHVSFDRTVSTTVSLLEFIRLCAPRAPLILASSAAVYGKGVSLPNHEASACNPVSPYGILKQSAENLCAMYGQHFCVVSARVRLFSVYGSGLKKQILWDACQKVNTHDLQFYGTGKERRDFLHVEDAARLFYCAHEHASALSPVFNGGTGTGTTIQSLIQLILEEFGVDQVPRFSGNERTGDPPVYVADITRATSFGWSPQVDLRTGVASYVNWFKALAR